MQVHGTAVSTMIATPACPIDRQMDVYSYYLIIACMHVYLYTINTNDIV